MVVSSLSRLRPDLSLSVLERATVGDRIVDRALSKIGEKSLFTKELEEGLEAGEVHFVVHSLKDMPTALPHNMTIAAITE
jgi:hydroxymethylbilane synthase